MANVIQRNFAGGELAPALYSRTDQVKYATGLRTCRNFIVQRHGGAANRPGTRYVQEVKDSTKTARLIKFVFNSSQTYVLELGDHYLRLYQNGGQVVVSGVAAWSNATAYLVGDLVVSGGINYYCVQAHTNHLPPNATYWYALAGVIYEIPTPWGTADLPDIDYAESADVVTLVHPSYPPQELKRFGNTRWTLGAVVFGPAIAGPTPVNASGGTAVTPFQDYTVTAVDANGEESLIASFVAIAATPSATAPIVVTWGAAAGAAYYNVYRAPDGVTMGWIGTAVGLSFSDTNLPVNYLQSPPVARALFFSNVTYPSAVALYQQRRLFANSVNEPEKVWASRTAQYRNFTTSFPLQDDDAVTFQIAGRQVNAVKHLLDLERLLVFTAAGEWIVEGDDAGVLRPVAINPRQHGYAGSGRLAPLVVVDTALYVQARGNRVRDLRRAIQQGFDSSDLTIFASHLVDGYTIVDWDYAQIPHSVIWAVRSDGVLLGLTYLREHDIWGWHRHDTDGTVENVCVVPEGGEDAVYLLVRRTINGVTKRYVERFTSRAITALTDVRELVFADASLVYDGRNTGAETMVVTGGVSWDYTETLTITRSVGGFTAGDVGNAIQLTAPDGTFVTITITGYTSGTVVTGKPNVIVPVALRSVATSSWVRAVKVVSGLSHLEGKKVSILGDGYVVASPNNADYDAVTVTGGSITLPTPYGVIQVGLPYLCDLETLDIDTAQGASLKDKRMAIGQVGLMVEKSRGIWAGRHAPESDALNTSGDPLWRLQEAKVRESESYTSPVALLTGDVDVTIETNWDSNGRVFIRQVDPLPLTVLSARPQGMIPVAA